jgi:hypothetical protein
MQIAFVEITTSDGLVQGETQRDQRRESSGRHTGESREAPAVPGFISPLQDEATVRVPRASGVFPSVRVDQEWSSANDVWRWVPPAITERPDGCVRILVFQRGAVWPPGLARDLSGGVTTCIVAEAEGDGLSGLLQRVVRRANYVGLPVAQLVWLSGDTRRTAPVRFVRQLATMVEAASTALVVRAAASGRSGQYRREHVEPSPVWPVRATGSG